MKIKRIFKVLAMAGVLAVPTTSCSDWLDVKMSDKIMENALFSTNNGFMTALNGVYMGMIDVYGDDLSVGIIDVMAQYYDMVNGNHTYKVFANYQYEDEAFKTKSNNIWTKMYALLANVNNLLEHCDEEGSALRSEYYPIVKGEALALRAMMHFDLLRLYGPSYNENTKSTTAIPYQEDAHREISPLRSAELDGTETYLYMIPLIRLSEAYLIAAECAATPEEALEYLVAIREHRNCHMALEATSMDGVKELVTKEFAREVLGEGQLFFYYKRLNMDKFLDGSKLGSMYEMLTDNYQWPLPDVEINKRGSTNN